ncbi:ATP-binding cassette subfamily B protein [Pseudoclavibacter chungangensis]|uniref:ABC transporter ATP-binding protein n=1 Tax=Pseudoclavibacter chungangensis TaxID=587635 RepID=UPI0017F9F32F|nr:ABC transporter ATP-binding protein [Pseudoclavibacter chungangensis]NYJ68401.1 ATP-binding cassette subfamily B protein [Pseudoclavibacter chungangensis]
MTLTSNPAPGIPTAPPTNSIGDAVRRHRLGLVASAALAIVAAACSLAPYVAVFAVVRALFVDDAPGAVVTIAAVAAAAVVLRAIASGLSTHVGHVSAYRVLLDLRFGLVRKLRRMPLARVQARSTGEIKKLLHDDVEQLEEALAHGVPDGAAAAAVPIATTALLFVVDWRLALVALASLVVLVVISAVGMTLAQRNNAALATHALVLERAVTGYLQGLEVIRSYVRPDSGYDQARGAVLRGAELQQRATRGPLRWLASFLTVGTGLALAALLPVAGLGLEAGTFDLATVLLFLLVGIAYLTPIIGLVGTLATIMSRIQFAAGGVRALFAEDELPESESPGIPTTFDVRLDGVTFAYGPERPALHDVTLHVPEGSSLALVGETGSGKSTVARLISRFADADEGTVRIGGVDVRDIPATELSRIVAFVQQNEYVFAASLMANIRIARPGASDEEVVRAGETAQLGDVAAALADGWATELPEGGGRLSGGQRQRIAIARAVLKDARVIVLDEATAALDQETERRTLDALDRLTEGRTVITIAHRLATIAGSDRIARLDGGRVTAQDHHERLLETHEPYRALWHAYERADGWRIGADDPEDAAPGDAGVAREEGDDAEVRGEDGPAVPVAASGTAPARRVGDPSTDAGEVTDIVRPGLGRMGFLAQWRAMYGRSLRPLVRGIGRILLEGAFRSVPVVTILVIVLAATGAVPGLALDAGLVWLLTAVLAASIVARLFAAAWANALVWRLAADSKAGLQLSVLDRLRRVPLGFVDRVDRSRIGTVVTNDAVMVDFQNLPQQLLGALVQPTLSAVALFVVDWRLALATLVGVPLFWLITAWGDRIFHRAFADHHLARGEATTVMVEQARGAAVLRGAPGSWIAERYVPVLERLARTSTDMSVRATPATALGSIVIEIGQVVLILVGAAAFAAGLVPASVLMLFLVLSLTVYQPIQELMLLTGYRRNQQQIAAKIAEVWDEPVLTEPASPAEPDGAEVEFRDVGFRYRDEDAPALDGVSFRAERGRVTALVGASGSGKSTIARLVNRMWDPAAGSVRIGGRDLRELGSDRTMRLVATVFQDVHLFDDTVRANVTLGRPEASEEDVWRALRAAQCDDVVDSLPDGLDTVLADGGADLSGGQRQRLSIARALLKDSPVLVLDEAVASVDPATEARIQSALAVLMRGRTTIVIAHRLSTVRGADTIVVVEGGRVAGIGTAAELHDSSPAYRALADAARSEA